MDSVSSEIIDLLFFVLTQYFTVGAGYVLNRWIVAARLKSLQMKHIKLTPFIIVYEIVTWLPMAVKDIRSIGDAWKGD